MTALHYRSALDQARLLRSRKVSARELLDVCLDQYALHNETLNAVILTDLGMPGMDGYQLARRIRQDADFHDVKLIALTGWGQPEDRHRSTAAGFDHHLVKPVQFDALQSLLLSSPPTPA